MPEYPHLPNAPIQEAVIDIRFEVPETTDLVRDEAVHALFTDRFPHVGYRRELSGEFEIRKDRLVATDESATVVAVVFKTDDEDYVLQLRRDRLVFSRLPPYETWERLRASAFAEWSKLSAMLGVQRIIRLGVRYINRFEVEVPAELEDYLVAPPELPAGVEGSITDFLWQTAFIEADSRTTGRVTTASQVKPGARQADLILDIDCYQVEPLPATNDIMAKRLDELRDLKNRIFFGSFTDSTLEAFR